MSSRIPLTQFTSFVSLLALGVAMSPAAGRAQSTPVADSSAVPARARFSIGSAQTIAGFVRMSSPDLDARLRAAGLPDAARTAGTVGFGADVRGGRLLFGASWQSMLTRNRTDVAYRTRMSGNYALFDVGVAALRTSRLSIYPIAGVGATRLSLSVKERGDFTFDDGLERPGRELSMSGSSGLVHAGVLAERRFVRRGGSEYALSVRAGVTRSMGAQAWQSDESHVRNGPSGIRGTYVRISFSKPLQSRRDAALPIGATLLQTALR